MVKCEIEVDSAELARILSVCPHCGRELDLLAVGCDEGRVSSLSIIYLIKANGDWGSCVCPDCHREFTCSIRTPYFCRDRLGPDLKLISCAIIRVSLSDIPREFTFVAKDVKEMVLEKGIIPPDQYDPWQY